MKSLSILSRDWWYALIAAVLLAGIVAPQAQNEVKPTAYEKIPAIDLSQFSEKQQAAIIKRANAEGCDCGCSMTVAQCRNDDQTCGKGMALAKAIVKDVTGVDIKVAVAKPEADNSDWQTGRYQVHLHRRQKNRCVQDERQGGAD